MNENKANDRHVCEACAHTDEDEVGDYDFGVYCCSCSWDAAQEHYGDDARAYAEEHVEVYLGRIEGPAELQRQLAACRIRLKISLGEARDWAIRSATNADDLFDGLEYEQLDPYVPDALREPKLEAYRRAVWDVAEEKYARALKGRCNDAFSDVEECSASGPGL